MRRGLLFSLSLILLAGCYSNGYRKVHGMCDCQVYPISHGTPSPLIRPASSVAVEPPPATGTIDAPAPQQ